MEELHVIQYSERMWILCGPRENTGSGIVPLIYKDRATAWFTREDLGRAFIRGISSLAASGAYLAEVSGFEALCRLAAELQAAGILEIYFDLSPSRNQRADRIEGFILELVERMNGKGKPVLN